MRNTQYKININQRDNRFSIRKFNVGVASIAVSSVAIAGMVFLGNTNLAYAGESDSNFNRTGTGDSTEVNAQEFVMVTHEKPGGVVEDVVILKSKFSESLDQLKKDYPGFTATSLQHVGTNKYKIIYTPVTTTNQPSSTAESVATRENSNNANSTSATANQTQPITENRVSLQGHLVGNQTEYNVGEQIISTFRLDVSAPSKLEDGSYILVNLPANEPITDVQFGSALKVEKVNDTQYKIHTGEVPSGSYASFNISYKFDKYRTGRNSQTTITAQVVDKTGAAITPTTSTTARVTNTNKSGYANISVDSESGARDLALFSTNAPGDTIDESKNKELVLKLTTFNKETSAVNKIVHEVTLPTGAVLSQTSTDAGWTQEGNIARYTRTITDAKPVFEQGNNTSDDTLRINMRQAGTLEEFLKGKEFTFTDNVTYTDKSGETNTSQGSTSLVVKAVNPYKDNGGGATPNAAGAQPPLVINNFTNEQNHENRVNIAIPGITPDTDDKRIIVFWRSVDTPTKVKEVELTIDSDFDQKRSIEFYGIWNKNGAYADWYAPDNLGTSNTFEVYTVNGTTETKLGEIAFKKGGGTSIDLPEGTTKVLLRPKGEMTFTNDTLSQAGIYLKQNLKGLEKAKQMIAEGKEAKSIVTAKVSTQDTDVVNTSVSKTILADARTALKLTPRTVKIETVLAGNKTQLLSSGIEAYDYSPSGLGNRVYGTITSHGATTDKSLTYLGAKNAKIIVELPDGFSYEGNNPLVTKDDNYQNTGKRVLIIDPKDSNTRENVTPNLEFNVAKWVQTGSYRLKYTLVWEENRLLHGLNPNDEYDGDKKIINTSTFTYEIPVSNTLGSRLHVDVTDKNNQREGYTTSLKNLAPKADVTYRFTLSNRDNSKLSNNEVLVTLPKKGDKNIVDTSINRNSAFDVEATGEAIAPAGWTAYYSTSPINGNANEVAAAATLTADQVTDWSKVTAVKFVSNPGTTLNPGLSNEFLLPARIASDAQNNQVANITAAAKTNAEERYNEANTASVTIKIEDIKNGAVKIAYEDMQGNTIKPAITAIEKRAYTKDYNVDTKEYKPDTLIGKDGKEYYFVKVKDSSPKPTGTIDSPEVTVTYVYDLLYDEITKATKQTVTYEGAGENTPAPNEQADYTFTRKTNKVTNVTTWNEETHTYGFVTTPKVEGYYADKAQAGGKVVTPTNPEASDKVVYKPLGKVILVDEGGNEIPNTPKPTYKNDPNDPTVGGETPIPEIPDGYEIKPKQDVPGFNPEGKVVTPPKPGEDTRIVLVAKTVPVTPTTPQNPNEDPQNPQPGDPIDPKNPNGPKWTKEALDKLNNIKSVTRTITYIKDGTTEEVSPTEAPKWTDKVSFTRTVVVNPKDGSVVGYDTTGDGIADVAATDTTSGWKAAGTAKFTEKTSPVVKGYVVKSNQDTQGDLVEADGSKVKASTTDLTVDSPNQDLKVRYVPVGTWTPKVPEGATPIDPIPYPNDPTDPGKVVDPNKPTDPNEPNKPSVPVIPHIPETTPKDPEGNPLKPVDPQDPSKGYVPPTPKTPTGNTEIKYEKDTQKATVKYVVEGTNTVLHTDELEGKSGAPIDYTTATKLAELKAGGYELVNDGFTTATDKNFDKDTKVDQNFVVTVKSKVVDVPPFDPTNPNDPNTPKPGQPIDPENPTGPKWTEELIKSLETTKHVNRTISYVKEDGSKVEYTDKDGNKSTVDVTDKVTFTRPAKINVVTGTIEYGKWTPVNNDTTFDKVTSPVAPGYVLKDASQKEVAETTGLTENSKDETIKVVYVPVGKVTITVPPGVTPPTPVMDTPYENVPGEPGKVVPPSPTKPTDPQDPNSPKVPVIPHIPGTTPQVPKDPTKPVDPNTNPLVPLEPVTPGKPEDGYKVPPVPTDPTKNLEINYEKDTQEAITNFVDNNGKVVSDPVVDQGDSGSKFTKGGEVESKIKELVKKGYVVTSNEYPSDDKDRVFDKDKDKDQIFNVTLTPLIVPTDPNSPDKPQVPTDPTKPVGPNNPLKPVTPSTPEPGKPVFPEDPNSPVWPETVKDMVTESSATRTITYVDQNGKEVAATHTETIKFKRSAKVNLVTGEITYGEWTVVGDDTILDGNKLPKVDGYIARGGDIKESQEDIKATVGTNITQTVVYDKLGSWVPKVPENATPVPPITYPNDPTDPTKPGTDKPKVPYVPGFIPVDPNGNPLKPVDPNDPTKGYEVPDVPADPTQDTPIKYIPVPTPNNGGGNNGGGGGNIPTPQPQPQPNPAPAPQPEPSPAPNPVPVTPETPEQPVAPVPPEQPAEPSTPQYMDGQRELPNTGTEANSSLAALGLLGALSGFGLIARKKRKDEE